MLDTGAAAQEAGHAGFTALHWASQNGHEGVVRSMLDAFAQGDIWGGAPSGARASLLY